MGKEKKERRKSEVQAGEEVDKDNEWRDQVSKTSVIAKPLSSRKLAKKIYKVIKKASGKKQIRQGIRDVQKFIRKGERGVVVIAGDTTPLEVICHMPVFCEEKDIPYCYTPSKQDLGMACGTNRQVCTVLVKPGESYQELYDTVSSEVSELPLPI